MNSCASMLLLKFVIWHSKSYNISLQYHLRNILCIDGCVKYGNVQKYAFCCKNRLFVAKSMQNHNAKTMPKNNLTLKCVFFMNGIFKK